MKLTVEINGDNAAFDDDDQTWGFVEFASILRVAAGLVEEGTVDHRLLDTNGNKVGFVRIEDDD